MVKSMRIPQNTVSGIPLVLGLEPECRILVFMWSFEPLQREVGCIPRELDVPGTVEDIRALLEAHWAV